MDKETREAIVKAKLFGREYKVGVLMLAGEKIGSITRPCLDCPERETKELFDWRLLRISLAEDDHGQLAFCAIGHLHQVIESDPELKAGLVEAAKQQLNSWPEAPVSVAPDKYSLSELWPLCPECVGQRRGIMERSLMEGERSV